MNVVASHFFFFFFYPPLCVIVSPSHIVPAETTYRKPRKLEAMKLHVYRGKIQVSFPYNIYSPLFIFWHTHKTKKKRVAGVGFLRLRQAANGTALQGSYGHWNITPSLFFCWSFFFFYSPLPFFFCSNRKKKKEQNISLALGACVGAKPPHLLLLLFLCSEYTSTTWDLWNISFS